MYKLLKFNRPPYLRNRINLNSELTNIKRSNKNPENDPDFTLSIDFARTECYKNSFLISGATLWNRMPVEMRKGGSLSAFKKNSFRFFGEL